MANPANQDSDDLEALFDSIISANTDEPKPAAKVIQLNADAEPAKVINQVGQMARKLHDTLRELGLHKEIEKATSTIPDARDRLNYVATLTQQAAERVLNATESAQPLVDKLSDESQRLAAQWDLLFQKKLDVQQFKALVTQTHAHLHEAPKQGKEVNAYLLEIMMAQDFQDLTGQVIKKIIQLTQEMEKQLVELLLENAPPAVRAENAGLLNGPVIKAAGRDDVVTSQDQVDDLLESLGF
ncbi:MAG: protein phosphatase CheZ [Sideroxydans sp. RIFOXYB12_FULL_59_6]|nr:MAG: protein phosphatase CheZ [Sideroxydans sp. RIFOXYB12_FULL_59_6]